MDAALMLATRFGLLALLWLFIFLVMMALRRDVKAACGSTAPGGSGSQPGS